MDTASRIKSARQRRKLTQKQLADLLGISVQAVSQWENGHTSPSVHNYELLSDFLRADFDWLRGASEANTKEVTPSQIESTFGEGAPVIGMRDTVAFVRGVAAHNPQMIAAMSSNSTVIPRRTIRGSAFAIILSGDDFLDPRFANQDLLIFDNGVAEVIGDVVLSAILLPGGKYDIALTEVIASSTSESGAIELDIRPLTQSGADMYATLGILFFPVIAVMVEHTRFRRT